MLIAAFLIWLGVSHFISRNSFRLARSHKLLLTRGNIMAHKGSIVKQEQAKQGKGSELPVLPQVFLDTMRLRLRIDV